MRSLMFMGLLAAAVGGPYLYSQKDKLGNVSSLWKSKGGQSANHSTNEWGDSLDINEATSQLASPDKILTPQTVPLEGLPTFDLAEVLRMDVTPDWVYQRWSRKSTALADIDLYGVRVPVVTGTMVDDIAGSLTYYFNSDGAVEHISFLGRTGDPRRLVGLVTQIYGFRPQQPGVSGEQIFQVRWNGKPTSELRIRPSSVLWANSPHTSYRVELELARPGSSRVINKNAPAVGQLTEKKSVAPKQ